MKGSQGELQAERKKETCQLGLQNNKLHFGEMQYPNCKKHFIAINDNGKVFDKTA